jgi:hypothetical protein
LLSSNQIVGGNSVGVARLRRAALLKLRSIPTSADLRLGTANEAHEMKRFYLISDSTGSGRMQSAVPH